VIVKIDFLCYIVFSWHLSLWL